MEKGGNERDGDLCMANVIGLSAAAAKSATPNKPSSQRLESSKSGETVKTVVVEEMSSGFIAGSDDTAKVPSLSLEIPLNSQGYSIINVARLLEAKYGFQTAHQRIEMSLAQALLNGRDEGSSDDDELSDFEEGDKADYSTSDREKAQEKSTVKKKKRTITERYDSNDPFIDDAEDVGDKVGHAATDGYFVFAGPLIQDFEKSTSTKGYICIAQML